MIQECAGDPVPGRWPQAGGRALYRSRDEIGPSARAASVTQLAGKIGGGWLTLAAEMAGLTTGSWRPPPDRLSPDPALPRVATRTLRADAGSVHAARDFTVTTLRRWGTADRSQDIALVVSELLTNALRHALPGSAGDGRPSWPIRLGLLQPGSCVLCAVADPSRTAPVLQARGSLAETGRGLHLICALSDQWGYTPSDTGKVVWAMFVQRLTGTPSST
ncbi:MAG: ATP-binding protein [Actinomycetota bacterium]|nr:ATP-binding protein [Actinomycetota bacterium]